LDKAFSLIYEGFLPWRRDFSLFVEDFDLGEGIFLLLKGFRLVKGLFLLRFPEFSFGRGEGRGEGGGLPLPPSRGRLLARGRVSLSREGEEGERTWPLPLYPSFF